MKGEGREKTGTARPCALADHSELLEIINAGAQAYHGVIPADRWREPYMPPDELVSELADGVVFSGWDVEGSLVGVMGVQRRRNIDLIRHAYVRPAWQGRGVGTALLAHLRRDDGGVVLVGTWRAAVWAVRFYERHGFSRVPEVAIAPLLRAFWTVPERQIATSLVLASPAMDETCVANLISAAGP